MKFFRKRQKPFEEVRREIIHIRHEDVILASHDELYLGTFNDSVRGTIHVSIALEDRFRHCLIVGATGTGKSNLLINMILQDIYAGRGLCFIDPKGDAIEDVLMRIPESRVKDVILIDPANYDKVVGLNFLELPRKGLSEIQINAMKEVIVADLVALMRQQTAIWGERFGRIFETLVRAILDFNERVGEEEQLTFLDLYVLLTDEEVRNRFAETVKDPIIREYLLKVNEMQDDVMEPVIRRLNDWVMNKVARQIVAHRKSSFDFREAIDTNKIILVRVPKGEVGVTIMQLIGTTVLSKIWAAAKSRVDIPQEDRKPFFLYIDEFANFAFEGSTFDEIFSEARAFKLGLIVATQYPSQLSKEVMEAVYGNCGTVIAFNPQNPKDASVLIKRFPGVKVEDLLSLGLYTVMLRLMVRNELTDPFIIRTYPPTTPLRSREEIKWVAEKSLEMYGKNRISELDLSASLRRIKELCRSHKEGYFDEMLEILYSLVIQEKSIDYRNFSIEAKKRALSVNEKQFSDLLQLFEDMGLVELRSDVKTGKITPIPKPERLKAQFWDGKFNTILAGFIDHRKLIERVYEYFVKMGFIVEVPKEGKYMPDLVLRMPVIEPEYMHELVQARQLTAGRSAVVEIETTTQTRPGRLLTKLKRAYMSNMFAIFVTLGSGDSAKEYYADARYIMHVLTDMRGRNGFYKTDEVERDSRGRKLWENKHTGQIAYEANGALYSSKGLECTVSEAPEKGWIVKKKVFDPEKEFGGSKPRPGVDFAVLVFPPDDFDFPVVSVIRGGAGFWLMTLDGREVSQELESAFRRRRMKEGKYEQVGERIKRSMERILSS
ncbi:hypothetical protein DRP05_04210 [Archaeoglobales archaeon]|nr:MAG: hypothetical protein DRP05_04210 [Archaeoglobales archaeon]